MTRSMEPGARIKMDERDGETSCQHARPTEHADDAEFTQDQGSESKSSASAQNALHDGGNSPLPLIACGCSSPFVDEHGRHSHIESTPTCSFVSLPFPSLLLPSLALRLVSRPPL